MKKLLILLVLIIPLFSEAQDWKSIRLNDTTYYTIPSANDYLRVIWIDSTTVAGSDSIFHFYPSIRLGNTSSNCLDTLGPTWLGKNFIKKANCDELFFNRWLDTIILKPTSILNSTWVMHTDTSGNEFRATITASDTLTIEKQLDSIKEVTIRVYYNNVIDTTALHHNRKMILSKNHGFVDCLEWYGFPYSESSSLNMYESFFKTHTRFYNGLIFESGSNNIDLPWKYQIGNVWQFERVKARYVNPSIYENVLTITEDSVMNVQVNTSNSRTVTFKTKISSKYVKQGFADSLNYHAFTRTEVISNSVNTTVILPEFNNNLYYVNSNNSPIRYYGKLDCDRPKVLSVKNGCQNYDLSPCPTFYGFSVSACVISVRENWFGFGQTEMSYYFPGTGVSSTPPYDTKLIYSKINNCEFGNRFPVWPVSTKNTLSMEIISLYPNPSSQEIYIKAKGQNKILFAELYTLQGKQITSCKNCQKLNTSKLAHGIYILNIQTDKGLVRKKIVKN